MTRIAHIADLHLTDRRDDSRATLAEQRELLGWIGEHAARHGAAVMFVAGDVFDAASTPAERNVAISVFKSWAGRMPVVVVRGNHDRGGDLFFLGELCTTCPIHVYSRPEVLDVAGATVACLPWPSKASLGLGTDSQPESDAGAALGLVLKQIEIRFRASALPCILLAHAELGSARLDTGIQLMAHAELPLAAGDLLDTGADYVALGHVHKHQVVQEKICYAGSVRQTNFGEDACKGYCLVDVARGAPPVIQHIQAPSRELVTIGGEWSESGLFFAAAAVRPAGYRLTYDVTEDLREQARSVAEETRARLLKDGAHSVKIDARITPTHRVRSEEIRGARSVAEKLHAYWGNLGTPPAGGAAILKKLAALESEGQP